MGFDWKSLKGRPRKSNFESVRERRLRAAVARHERGIPRKIPELRIVEFRPSVFGVVNRRGTVLRWAITYAIATVMLADLESAA